MVLEDAAAEAYTVKSIALAYAATDLDDRSAERVVKACGDLACLPVPGDLFDDGRDGLTKIHHNRFLLLQIELVAIRHPRVGCHLQCNSRLPFKGDLSSHSQDRRYSIEQPPA